jgi:hypothetical protein
MTTVERDEILSKLNEDLAIDEVSLVKDVINILQSLPMFSAEPVEYLLDGMRVKLNFNSVGNITSLQNLKHDLQGRWVSFVGAENDKHLKATSPQALTPITADDVTDEMVDEYHKDMAFSQYAKLIITAAYNAVIKGLAK